MGNSTPIPFFPVPPTVYSARYMSEITRAFSLYTTQQLANVSLAALVAQIRNTNAISNLNATSTFTDVVIDGEQDQLDSGFTNGTTGIVCGFTGRVKCTVHIDYSSSVGRASVHLGVAVDGVTQPILGKGGYIRSASGHNDATATSTQYIQVTSGDEVTLQTKQGASGGTCAGTAGKCMLLMERWA